MSQVRLLPGSPNLLAPLNRQQSAEGISDNGGSITLVAVKRQMRPKEEFGAQSAKRQTAQCSIVRTAPVCRACANESAVHYPRWKSMTSSGSAARFSCSTMCCSCSLRTTSAIFALSSRIISTLRVGLPQWRQINSKDCAKNIVVDGHVR